MTSQLDAALLRAMPLAEIRDRVDKETRGRLVVVGGSLRVPGAPLLAGVAGLRAGAGKVQLAIPKCLAASIGAAFPESGILPLPETADGEIDCDRLDHCLPELSRADAILIGPGVMNTECGERLSAFLLERLDGPVLVIDAVALTSLTGKAELVSSQRGRVVITPHAGEMASLTGLDKERVTADPLSVAMQVSEEFNCTTVLKGSKTTIVQPRGVPYTHHLENAGLATAGSGDVLAGIIAGLIARGNSPILAALWGVHVHAQAGNRLAKLARIGFLARELLEEIPRVLDEAECATPSAD